MENMARIAVVGTGWWATQTHIPAVLARPDAKLVALCDTHAAKVEAAGENYGVDRRYTDLDVLLDREELDGVVVATNHAGHYPVARRCLEHGLHVVIEKPMTLFAREARLLVDLAARQGREIVMGYPYNYLPYVRQARKVIQSGEFGAIQFINCEFSSDVLRFLQGRGDFRQGPVHGPGAAYANPVLSGGGHGHTQITHFAGLLFFVTGQRTRRVHALMHNQGLKVDLVSAMIVDFEDGALATVSGTGNLGGTRAARQRLQVYCEHGVVELSAAPYRGVFHRPGLPLEVYESSAELEYHYPADAPVNNLVDIILGRGANASPAEAGWRAVEVLDAAYRSAARGGEAVWTEELYP